jgi:hypothetical protein
MPPVRPVPTDPPEALQADIQRDLAPMGGLQEAFPT